MQTTKVYPRWPFFTALAIIVMALLLGFLSYPKHPLYQGDITEVGGGYDYFFSYAIANALNDKISNIYSSQELLDYTSKLSGSRNWAVNDNHLLPFYIMYLPFASRTFSTGYYLHLWVNLNLLWLAIFALCLSLFPTHRQAYMVMILLVAGTVTLGPAVDNIWLGQIGFALTGLLTLMYLLDRADFQKPAGICLALAILMKMYPALLLIYFGIKRRWMLLKWTIGTLVVMSLAAAIQWGLGHYINYLDFLGHTMAYNAEVANQSLIGVLANACPYLATSELKLIHICLMALVTAALVWFTWSRPRRAANASQGLLEFSLWLCAANVVSPLSWSHHHIYLVLPLLAFLSLLLSPSAEPGEAAAVLVPNRPDKAGKSFWSMSLTITKTTRYIALAGVALIALLWSCEGETATNMNIKAFHYGFCVYHLGLVGLVAIIATAWYCLNSLPNLESTTAISTLASESDSELSETTKSESNATKRQQKNARKENKKKRH